MLMVQITFMILVGPLSFIFHQQPKLSRIFHSTRKYMYGLVYKDRSKKERNSYHLCAFDVKYLLRSFARNALSFLDRE